MVREMEENHLNEFLSRVLSFTVLYCVTSFFFWDLSRFLQDNESSVINTLILFAGIFLLFIFITIARIFIHMVPDTMVEKKMASGYCKIRLLFSLSVLCFFVTVLVWVFLLGGVLNSAMASLLTTAPAFFVFGMSDRYWIMIDREFSPAATRPTRKFIVVDRIARSLCIATYFVTVINFDHTHVADWVALEEIQRIGMSFVSVNADAVTSSREYLLFALCVFLGSVAATVQPFVFAKFK